MNTPSLLTFGIAGNHKRNALIYTIMSLKFPINNYQLLKAFSIQTQYRNSIGLKGVKENKNTMHIIYW